MTRWHQRAPTLLVLWLLVVLSAGCAKSQETKTQPSNTQPAASAAPAASTAPAPTKAPVKVRLLLDWKPGGQHAPVYYAHAQKFWAQEGLDVEIMPGPGSADAIKLSATKGVEFAMVDAIAMVQAWEQGVPLKAIGMYYQRPMASVLSPAGKALKSPQELVGQKIGIRKGSSSTLMLELMLKRNGIAPEQVQMIDTGQAIQALLVGQVAATMGFVNDQPVVLEAEGMPVNVLLIADYVKAYGMAVVAHEEFVRDKPDVVRAFLRGFRNGLKAAAERPEAAVEAVVKAVPDVDAKTAMAKHRRGLPFFESDVTKEKGYLWMTESLWKETVDTATQLGMIKTPVDIQKVFTNEYLQ